MTDAAKAVIVIALAIAAIALVATHQNRHAICKEQSVTGYCR